MNLHQLRLFYEVATAKSVTKAAKKLRISQPSVTAQIKKFEEDEGISLLEPDGRGIKATDFGQEIYQLARELFALEGQIQGVIDQVAEKETIRLAGNYLAINLLLPKWLPQFKEKFPSIQFSIQSVNSDKALDLLRRHEVELVLLGSGIRGESGLESYRVFRDYLIFVTSPEHPLATQQVTLDQLLEFSFIGREKGSFTQRRLEELFQSISLPLPDFSLKINNSQDGLNLAASNQGIYFCSQLVARDLIATGKLVALDVSHTLLENDVTVGTLSNRKISKSSQDFLKFVRESAQQNGA